MMCKELPFYSLLFFPFYFVLLISIFCSVLVPENEAQSNKTSKLLQDVSGNKIKCIYYSILSSSSLSSSLFSSSFIEA